MSFRELSLQPVDLGDGFIATKVWVSTGPIVLIRAVNKRANQEVKSRLDIQKRIFIDPMPGVRTERGMFDLVSSVESAVDEPPAGSYRQM